MSFGKYFSIQFYTRSIFYPVLKVACMLLDIKVEWLSQIQILVQR